MSAYMAWLNDNREKIKEENPGVSVTEVSKIAGQMWKKVEDDEKQVCKGGEIMGSTFSVIFVYISFEGPANHFSLFIRIFSL